MCCVFPDFYARCLLYHNVALPYEAFKCKIQKNRFTVTIALRTVLRWTVATLIVKITLNVKNFTLRVNDPPLM